MEVTFLFRRVHSPWQTDTESHFPPIVLLQTVCKYNVYYTAPSLSSVYNAGELYSLSALTRELVVVMVSPF